MSFVKLVNKCYRYGLQEMLCDGVDSWKYLELSADTLLVEAGLDLYAETAAIYKEENVLKTANMAKDAVQSGFMVFKWSGVFATSPVADDLFERFFDFMDLKGVKIPQNEIYLLEQGTRVSDSPLFGRTDLEILLNSDSLYCLTWGDGKSQIGNWFSENVLRRKILRE